MQMRYRRFPCGVGHAAIYDTGTEIATISGSVSASRFTIDNRALTLTFTTPCLRRPSLVVERRSLSGVEMLVSTAERGGSNAQPRSLRVTIAGERGNVVTIMGSQSVGSSSWKIRSRSWKVCYRGLGEEQAVEEPARRKAQKAGISLQPVVGTPFPVRHDLRLGPSMPTTTATTLAASPRVK